MPDTASTAYSGNLRLLILVAPMPNPTGSDLLRTQAAATSRSPSLRNPAASQRLQWLDTASTKRVAASGSVHRKKLGSTSSSSSTAAVPSGRVTRSMRA